MIDEMREIEFVVALSGRVTVRIGYVFRKIDTGTSDHRPRGRGHGEGTDVGVARQQHGTTLI
jgi:hypothetical protein